jgi:hypothetical protein
MQLNKQITDIPNKNAFCRNVINETVKWAIYQGDQTSRFCRCPIVPTGIKRDEKYSRFFNDAVLFITDTAFVMTYKHIYMITKGVPQTSATACTRPVQPIYKWWKRLVQRLPLQPVHGLNRLYMMKNLTHWFPYSLYWACTAYQYDEKLVQKLPLQAIYIMNKVGPETPPTACTWPVQSIYIYMWRKKLFHRLPFQSVHGLYGLYYVNKRCSPDFRYSLYIACTAYIYVCTRLVHGIYDLLYMM